MTVEWEPPRASGGGGSQCVMIISPQPACAADGPHRDGHHHPAHASSCDAAGQCSGLGLDGYEGPVDNWASSRAGNRFHVRSKGFIYVFDREMGDFVRRLGQLDSNITSA